MQQVKLYELVMINTKRQKSAIFKNYKFADIMAKRLWFGVESMAYKLNETFGHVHRI